jgi:hypothetical protein
MMSIGAIIAIVLIGVIVAAVAGIRFSGGRALRRRFGAEYDHLAREVGPRKAQAELTKRQRLFGQLSIRPLTPEQRARYESQWTRVQERFIEDPAQATRAAAALVVAVARDRGFSADDNAKLLTELSVGYSLELEGYRRALETADPGGHDRRTPGSGGRVPRDVPRTDRVPGRRNRTGEHDHDEHDSKHGRRDGRQPQHRRAGGGRRENEGVTAMSFKLSRPASTERAGNEPAETDPAAEAKPVVGTPPVSETEPSDAAGPDATGVPTTAEIPAPRSVDTLDTATEEPRPSFQPRGAAEPVSTPAFTGPPDDGTPLDGPLLPDATQLQANWRQIQASFIDDPRGSVAEAAALVDHAAQALTGVLQQRQRRLRESWDTAGGTADGASPDTEGLRVAMQRYRTLFNHICQP